MSAQSKPDGVGELVVQQHAVTQRRKTALETHPVAAVSSTRSGPIQRANISPGVRPGPCWRRRGQPASTSIVTGTRLVMTSNTAERARDCSTISRSFSAGASPLTVNRTLIFS